jgi:hypothetical protein
MGENRNAYRILVGKPEGKRPLGRPRRRWVDNIKMDLIYRWGGMESLQVLYLAYSSFLKMEETINDIKRTDSKFK